MYSISLQPIHKSHKKTSFFFPNIHIVNILRQNKNVQNKPNGTFFAWSKESLSPTIEKGGYTSNSNLFAKLYAVCSKANQASVFFISRP